jgi:hypothetical protein
MNDTVYDYPKSFCNCYRCTQNDYDVPEKGVPTNMSVYNFDFPDYFQCYDKKSFKHDLEPTTKKGFVNLNPEVYTENVAKNFSKIELPENFAPETDKTKNKQTCLNTYNPAPNGWLQLGDVPNQFMTNDPRLYHGAHQRWLTLDRPPADSNKKLYEIPRDKTLDKYGQYYNTYSDINAGHIMYYVDKELEDPFFKPNYANTGDVNGVLYKDPMGAMKPQYSFKNLKDDDPIRSAERDNYDGGLSWMQDSTNYRQDLMSLQQRKHNEQNWQYRYSPVAKK